MINSKYFLKGITSVKGIDSPALGLAASLIAIGALYKNLSKPPADPNQFSLAMKQMQHLKNLIGTKDQNLIIMGDLNMSGTSKRFTNFLEEVNLHTYISYTKRISTWPTNLPNFFGIQIDHVLFSKNFKVLNKKVTSHFGSDHRPLIVDLVF